MWGRTAAGWIRRRKLLSWQSEPATYLVSNSDYTESMIIPVMNS
jgi:hypothetical protein